MANRLANETSPYLLQHQENPVDWYPWGETALKRARTENKPILLSIGYSACHWCHVMAHESFENPQIAELMNANFINIKVDREERPDLDQIYQNVAQAITQGGGWPLTVFLTPDLKPFFGGTYYPPVDKYGRPGFGRVLKSLAEAYQKDPAGISDNAEKLTQLISDLESIPTTGKKKPEMESLRVVMEKILEQVDPVNGGLGKAPKFPNPMVFSFLWRMGLATENQQVKDTVLFTLRKMASGGIYDQLAGGFHRYSVDEGWRVPHFEKMLYDNGLLLKLYSEVLLNGNESVSTEDRRLFLKVITETVHYVLNEMMTPNGVFYSAQDADSEGVEGKYFVWTQQELSQVLTEEEALVFSLRYGVTSEGSLEQGQSILYLAQGISEVAQKLSKSETEVSELLDSASQKMIEVRSKRVAPGLDNKVLTSWNALMMSGMAWASQALIASGQTEVGERVYAAAARAFMVLCQAVGQREGRLYSTFQGGKGKLNGYLDDYAYMAMAALDLARFTPTASQVEEYLGLCQMWIDGILKHFKDPENPGYFFTSDDHEKLIQRPKTIFDQAIPSGTSTALSCIAALAELDWNGQGRRYYDEVDSQVKRLFPAVERNAYGVGEMLCLSLLHTMGPVTISGPKASILCRHPHVFQKPAELPEFRGLLVCHLKICSRPYESFETARKSVEQKIRVRG
jgi:uncharacterized protein